MILRVLCGAVILGAMILDNGWRAIPLGVGMTVIGPGGGLGLKNRKRPELWVFASTVLNIQAAITIASLLTGGSTGLPDVMIIPLSLVTSSPAT